MLTTAREFGMAVRRLRLESQLTQEELAAKAGVSRRWLLDFENGKPTVDLSRVMDCLFALDTGVELVPRAPR